MQQPGNKRSLKKLRSKSRDPKVLVLRASLASRLAGCIVCCLSQDVDTCYSYFRRAVVGYLAV